MKSQKLFCSVTYSTVICSKNQAFQHHLIHVIFLVLPGFNQARNLRKIVFILPFSMYFYCHSNSEGGKKKKKQGNKAQQDSKYWTIKTIKKLCYHFHSDE